jgi:hypothetical protein
MQMPECYVTPSFVRAWKQRIGIGIMQASRAALKCSRNRFQDEMSHGQPSGQASASKPSSHPRALIPR